MPEAKLRVTVKRLAEKDVKDAEQICRLAFGKFLGLSDPAKAFGDRAVLANRWRANPEGALGAYSDGELVGSNIVSRWGTFGFFGPLTIRPDLWDRGIAKELLGPTMELFSKWRTTQQGLFTFPQSPKHLGLYGKFGFSARFLTPMMTKKVSGSSGAGPFSAFSKMSLKEKMRAVKQFRTITNRIYPGLDLTSEISALDTLKLGEVIVIGDGSDAEGFAVCHSGGGTEAGSGKCYVKFGAVASGPSASARLRSLLSAVEAYASSGRLTKIEAGVNMGRRKALQELGRAGFKTEFVGVAMQRPDKPGFNRPDVFAIDDWK